MEPLVSVIIPAYNIEQYIERSITSICEQTYKNLEIIIVNDGSKDRTGELADKLAKADERIVVIHKENAGVSAARNTGLDIAKGEYIGFVDGDDYIDSDMYELLVKNAIKYNADISHCGYKMVFPDRIDYYYNTGEVRIQDNHQGVYDLIKADKVEPGLCNKLFRKDVIDDQRLESSIRINEDLLFNYLLFKRARKSIFEDLPKYHYMVRKNSAATSGININKVKDPLTVVERIMQTENGEIYKLLEKRYMYLLEKVSTVKHEEQNSELSLYCKEKRKELRDILKQKNYVAEYGKREMFQLKLAAKAPILYHIVHEVYATITGSKNKYRV